MGRAQHDDPFGFTSTQSGRSLFIKAEWRKVPQSLDGKKQLSAKSNTVIICHPSILSTCSGLQVPPDWALGYGGL